MDKYIKEYRISLRDMGTEFRTKDTMLFHNFEEAFAQLCLKHHITGYDLDKKGLMWVIGNINLEISDKLPIWNENVRFELWFSEVKKLRAFLEFEAYWQDKSVAHGDSCWFVLNQQTRRPVGIDEIVKPCGTIDQTVFESHKKVNPNPDSMELIRETDYTVLRQDLDYNGHVNNVSYIDWMELPKTYEIKNYSVNFLQECFLNEHLTLKLYKKDKELYFEVIKKDDTKACTIFAKLK